jgi:hypothetical protein
METAEWSEVYFFTMGMWAFLQMKIAQSLVGLMVRLSNIDSKVPE